jgi:hypothetical protein
LAAQVMSWSKAIETKSPNCISATGRCPAIAAPTATPAIPASATGVSIDRMTPYFCCRPLVAPKAPPWRPTSSPRQKTRGSASISSWRAALIASR